MPQLNKGGKFVFGWSLINNDGTVRFPEDLIEHYKLDSTCRIIIFTGSKSSGGFCVTTPEMLSGSKLRGIIDALPQLATGQDNSGKFYPYKGRDYAWLSLNDGGQIKLDKQVLEHLKLSPGDRLMAIKSSNIAFTMAAKGPLIERGRNFRGFIPEY